MRENASGVSQSEVPSTRIEPWLGLSCPVMSFMNVDLPAPFGPSRPVIPGGIDTVTSLSPLTCPYHFERCSAWTMGADAAGSVSSPSAHHLDRAHAPLEHERRAADERHHHEHGHPDGQLEARRQAEDGVAQLLEHVARRKPRQPRPVR